VICAIAIQRMRFDFLVATASQVMLIANLILLILY